MITISSIFTHKNIIINKQAERAFLVTSFIILTALGAYVRIPLPFTPVPITLQTFFVILCGAILGKKLGSLTQTSYVILGTLGLPIFQGYGAGFLHLAGPTVTTGPAGALKLKVLMSRVISLISESMSFCFMSNLSILIKRLCVSSRLINLMMRKYVPCSLML